MDNTLDARTKIYDWFQGSKIAQSHFTDAKQADAYAAYYTSMYLIQDTAESISAVCDSGFSQDPLRAYLELWGTLQALIIQQDAIDELSKAMTGNKSPAPSAWQEIRMLRNEIAGHPAAQGHKPPHKRSFVGRSFGVLDHVTYEQYQAKPDGTPDSQQQSIDLRQLIDRYDAEAAAALEAVLGKAQQSWP